MSDAVEVSARASCPVRISTRESGYTSRITFNSSELNFLDFVPPRLFLVAKIVKMRSPKAWPGKRGNETLMGRKYSTWNGLLMNPFARYEAVKFRTPCTGSGAPATGVVA